VSRKLSTRPRWQGVKQRIPTDAGSAREAAAKLERRLTPDFRRAVLSAIGALAALSVGGALGGISVHSLHKRLVVIGMAVAFVILGVTAVRSAAGQLARVVRLRGGSSAAATVRLLALLFGYVVVLIALFGLLNMPLGHLLVGGAITGVVVGIAAQQSLGNVFAGLVLLLARPFTIGDEVRVRTGSMGGPLDGTVVGMDLLYTKLLTDEGELQVPNAGLLSSAIGPRPPRLDSAVDSPGAAASRASAPERTQELPVTEPYPAERVPVGAGTRRPS
jgi:small-conductance mechanosensitive channel